MKKYEYKVNGVDYEVEIAAVEGKIAKVNVNGIPFEVEMQKPINAAKHPALAATSRAQSPVTPAQPAASAPVAAPVAAATPAAPVGEGRALKAPLPGTITEIKVQVGQQVTAGQTVIVLEAMKMANNIEAEKDGKVTAICVKPGQSVMEDDALVVVE